MILKIKNEELETDDITLLAGSSSLNICPIKPYHDHICSFLNDLSQKLMKYKMHPDIITFAFWCRKANIYKLKNSYVDNKIRIGRGLVFHITPSNVPINFAFSYVFGLISGNSNIVRVPSKEYSQIDIICSSLKELFNNKEYEDIYRRTMIVRYEHNDEITKFFSKMCHARVIWGGDATVNSIRQYKIPERSTEVVFGDRYSIAVLNADEIANITDTELSQLAENFYNDTYLMDQNACSSPHLIIWQGDSKETGKDKFWKAVYKASQKYELQAIHAVDKYTDLCMRTINNIFDINDVVRYDNLIYRVELRVLPSNIDQLRGKHGLFYEYDCDDLNNITHIINEKYQTLSYFGVDNQKLAEYITENHLLGIDRIVPVGKTLDINVIWDGYDIIGHLSRIIDVI